MKQIYSILSAALLVISCSRSEDFYAPHAQGDMLVVHAELVPSEPWVSRSESQICGAVTEVFGGGDFMMYGTKEAFRTDSVPGFSGSMTTRGTPIVSASGISNMRVNIFNTGASNWSTSSTRTGSIVATNVSGSFTTLPNYNWSTDATNKTSLFAYSPAASSTNGLTDVAPNKINYSIPTDVTKQPDLCVAAPQMNIINDDGTQQVCTFALSHQLTAVGFTMLGWNLKITSITVSNVATAGTLTMNSSGTMSWSTSATGSRSVGVTGSSYDHTINSSYADITTSDGYLMMIPHTLSSSAQVTIAYTSTGTGSTSGTITANLKDLGLTWEAGDRITYNIRLKTAPAVTSGDLAIEVRAAGYTTSQPMSFMMDNKDVLTFTWAEDWLKIHRGNPKTGDTSGGAVSGWSTGSGGPWNNIYFFATTNNPSEIADRMATVTVNGTRSGAKTFVVRQKFSTLKLDKTAPGETVPGVGKRYTVNVISAGVWTLTPSAGVSANVTSGTGSTTVVLTVHLNPNTTASRSVDATFKQNVGGLSVKWSGTQNKLTCDYDYRLQPASCYIAYPGKVILFDASKKPRPKGGSVTGTTTCVNIVPEDVSSADEIPASVELQWQTAVNHTPASGAANMVIQQLGYDPYSGTCGVVAHGTGCGNALVVGKNSAGVIIWSWHIWVTSGTPGKLAAYNGLTLMDRNLGAFAATNAQPTVENAYKYYGLLWAYGRKEPFTAQGVGTVRNVCTMIFDGDGVQITGDADGFIPGPEYDNISDAIRNPMVYYGFRNGRKELWSSNGKKSLYDPCPYGYRVMKSAAINLSKGKWNRNAVNGGLVWNGSWWPAVGERFMYTGKYNFLSSEGWYWLGEFMTFDYLGASSAHLKFDPYNNLYISTADNGYGGSIRCVVE